MRIREAARAGRDHDKCVRNEIEEGIADWEDGEEMVALRSLINGDYSNVRLWLEATVIDLRIIYEEECSLVRALGLVDTVTCATGPKHVCI